MSRNHRLGAATALTLLASVGLAGGALAASSTTSGTAATTTGGAQTGVGDNGPGGNTAVMPANPAMQTDRKPMSAQSDSGCAAAGETKSSGTACSTARKNPAPNPGASAAGGAASQSWNGAHTAGGNAEPGGQQPAQAGAGNDQPTIGSKQQGVVARSGSQQGFPEGSRTEPGQPPAQPGATTNAQSGSASSSSAPGRIGTAERRDDTGGYQQNPTMHGDTTTGTAGIPLAPKQGQQTGGNKAQP
jgi:hypothetical protein